MTDKENQSAATPASSTPKDPSKPTSTVTAAGGATTQPLFAGGAAGGASAQSPNLISVTVAPFTGGPFTVTVSKKDSVEELKKAVAKKLKVLKDRICLLYRESQLSDGSLEDNYLVDGSRITLLPRAETGLLAQKPEQSVMQALESLNDNQVIDFLSGKAPLNLTMRLGDHMMLIQLQLSTVNSHARRSKQAAAAAASAAAAAASTASTPTSPTSPTASPTIPTGSPTIPTPTPSSSRTFRTSHSYRPKLDTKALAEASKNLTQTLKQLSSEVLTTRSTENEEPAPARPRKKPRAEPTPSASASSSSSSASSSTTSSSSSSASSSGAIIESMHHHGKGVYSGTFSGTLNPALQDRNGQPKRDISTIIHILNDLLCAQYKNYRSHSKAEAAAHAQSAKAANGGPNNLSDSFVQDQLQVTKGKMEQLRRVMEERKARRRARREARSAPYSTSWSVKPNEKSSEETKAAQAPESMDIFNAELEPMTA